VSAGSDFVKKLRPAGCVLFLVLAVLVAVVCLCAGRDPIPGYQAPQTSAYYAQSEETLLELKAELEQNVFPALEGVAGCALSGDGRLIVSLESDRFAVTRAAILRYYDRSLFDFVRV